MICRTTILCVLLVIWGCTGVRSSCITNTDCDDGDVCTLDICQAGTCVFESFNGALHCVPTGQLVTFIVVLSVAIFVTGGFAVWTLWNPSRFASKSPSAPLTKNKMKW